MRELLVTIILLSVVSSEKFEPKKRLGIPPEEDPNFWPTRGRRSYWSDSRLFSNTFRHRDILQNPEIGYPSHSRSWTCGSNFHGDPGVPGPSDSWRLNYPRKNLVSLVFPLPDIRNDEVDIPGWGVRCSQFHGRGRRGDERWRTQQPMYVEEPRWIALDYDHGLLRDSSGDGDPFIVARGRKRGAVLDLGKGGYLDKVLGAHDVDPFFVARGKWEATESGKKAGDESVEARGPANDFDSRLRTAGIKEARKVSSIEDEKFLKKLPSTKPRVERSSDVFEGDEAVEWPNDGPGDDFENGVDLASRYSRPRDKHSNLQSILDEPFFISRGKKAEYDNEEGEKVPARIYSGPEDPDPVLARVSRFYAGSGFSGPENRVKKSKEQNKPPRNRRGMLDELLTSDDPFYVARGKKLSEYPKPRSQYFDPIINRADSPTADEKYSLFAKSTRTKLIRKLSDFSKDKNPGGDFFNLTNEPIIIKTI